MNYKEIRNYGKTIKTYFQFLSRRGFSVKQYDNGIDYEVIYSRPECEISIFCGLGVDAKMFALYKNRLIEDKQLIENSYLNTFIININQVAFRLRRVLWNGCPRDLI